MAKVKALLMPWRNHVLSVGLMLFHLLQLIFKASNVRYQTDRLLVCSI
jgi:hypothetical protein